MDPRPASAWARSPWFLTSRPQLASGTVSRPRLFERLDDALGRGGVAVVAAPSGFGKTVLLSSWAEQRAEPTAWLTVTSHETADEELLLLGILSAIERVSDDLVARADVRPLSVVAQPAELRDLVGRIAVAVAGLAAPVALVIDDAQHAGTVLGTRIVDILTSLTEGRLTFAIAGTPDVLPWFTSRITRDPRVALTVSELAMSVDEVIRDAAHRGEHLEPADAEARRAATGGWPIALHLHRFATERRDADDFWRDGLLVDFVDGNVLPALPPRLRDFVLSATACNRLDARLADALSGHDGGAALLEECVSSGLFLQRVSDPSGRTVYRWHDAFAEACRRIVERTDPPRSRDLDTIAAQALAERFPAEALLHAVRSGDAELTLDIIRASWIRIIVESGARVLHHSCLSLPESFGENPDVLIVRACCLNLLGDRGGSRLLAASALARGDADPHFGVTLAFAQLFLADAHDELGRAADEAQSLLTAGVTDPLTHAYRVFLLGWTRLRLRRDVSAAVGLLRTAMDEARLAGRPVLEKRAASNLMFALTYAGRFTDAERLRESGAPLGGAEDDWAHYDGGIGLFAVGFSAFWQGRFAESEASFRTLALREGDEESYAALGRAYLAFVAASHGDPRAVKDARRLLPGIGRAEMHGVPWPAYRAIARADLLAADGDLPQAVALVATLTGTPNVPVVRLVGAEIARRAGEHGLAMTLLEGLGPAERSVSYIAAGAETTAALIAHERGDVARAHTRIERALDAASLEGIRSPFLAKEPRLDALLSGHALAGTSHAEVIASILAAREATAPPPTLGGALSEREREILGYLRTSMTAAEIAAALFVSVNTVRTHQRAIYRKLGVSNRRDAVSLRP